MNCYKNYSTSALKVELENLKRLKQLVRYMNKPDNFTYIDILNLHNYLETLHNELQDVIKQRQ